MPKEGSKMPKETFFTAISRWRVVSRRALVYAFPHARLAAHDDEFAVLCPITERRHSACRETTLQREIAVKNVSLGIFDPSLGIFDPARMPTKPDFLGGFPPKPRSVLRNRQGITRLSAVSSRARVGCISPFLPPRPLCFGFVRRLRIEQRNQGPSANRVRNHSRSLWL